MIPQTTVLLLSTSRTGPKTTRNSNFHAWELPRDDAIKVYQDMQFAMPVTDRTIQEILQAVEDYAVKIVNETYERFASRHRRQRESEALDCFHNDQRIQSNTCNFCARCGNSLLRDEIVEGKN